MVGETRTQESFTARTGRGGLARDFIATLRRAGSFKPEHRSFLELSIYYFRARLTGTVQKALWAGTPVA